jgi:hypothetical protein
VDVRRSSQRESSECHGNSGVNRRSARRIPKPNLIEGNMRRKRHAARDPRGKPPGELRGTRGGRIRKRHADDQVHSAEEDDWNHGATHERRARPNYFLASKYVFSAASNGAISLFASSP